MTCELTITRRHLPHWAIDGATYFVTFRSFVDLTPRERKIVLDHIRSGDPSFYTLIAVVVMPDHVHLLLYPDEKYSLDRIMKGIKGVTARLINKHRNTNGQVWQHESYDHVIRNGNELKQKFYYIANNPVKAELVDNSKEYIGWYCNEDIIL